MVSLFATFIVVLTQILTLAIFIRAILTWFPQVPRDNPFVEVLYQITEPVLAPLRRVVPAIGPFDLTPIIAIILLSVISSVASGLPG